MDVNGFYPYINELINDVFKFKPHYTDKAKGIFHDLRSHIHTMVSIHIRLTDMDLHLKEQWNLGNAPDQYFEKAMKYFDDKYEVIISTLIQCYVIY